MDSMVNLLCVVHKAQSKAPTTHHVMRHFAPLKFPRTRTSVCPDSSAQLTPTTSRTALRENHARGQWKKMWFAYSGEWQRAHNPLDGPSRFTMLIALGRRSRNTCQGKNLTFSGITAFHSPLAVSSTRLAAIRSYRDLTKNMRELVRLHSTTSFSSWVRVVPFKILWRRLHMSTSSPTSSCLNVVELGKIMGRRVPRGVQSPPSDRATV